MDTTLIAGLLAPYAGASLPSMEQLDNISTYIDILLKWNARMNLTGIRNPEDVVERHFGESWFAARHLLMPMSPGSVIDVGAGAGFPGMVLKIFAPEIHLVLVESQNKKATFLKELARTLKMSNVEVIGDRAERLERVADLVTLRAVESFDQILPVADRLVAAGGKLAALIGTSQFAAALKLIPREWSEPVVIPNSSARILAVCPR